MAVFMINICKFNGCGLTFPGLGDLIQHIEDTHIDYDPIVVEQKEQAQPSCIPLSYVLRFFTDAARQEGLGEARKKIVTHTGTGMKCSNSNSSIGSSLQSSTPTGSDMEDEDARSESEDSNDSWTTPEEFSAEFILSLAIKSRVPVVNNKKNGTGGWIASTKDNNNVDKPFACPVPGCKKRYKNVNGIKYHSKNGHKKDGKVRKGFKCHCGKSYKTAQGLKTHTTAYHSGTSLTTITTPTGEILQIPTTQVTTLQPVRTLTVKQISASSLSSLGLPVKSIQSVVVATKSTNELISKNYDVDTNKTTTLRVLKDISLPIVKNNAPLQLSSTALQSLVNNNGKASEKEVTAAAGAIGASVETVTPSLQPQTTAATTTTTTTPLSTGGGATSEVRETGEATFEEVENVSDLVGGDAIGDEISVMNLEEVKEDRGGGGCGQGGDSETGKVFKIKLQPEKDKFIKLVSTDADAEKIQVGHVQIKLPDPKIKLTTIKPASIKLSSPQVIASLKSRLSPNLDSITKGGAGTGRAQMHDSLGILTPAASPLTSPDSKSIVLQTSKPSPLSPVLPLTPVSPVHNNKIYTINSLKISELSDGEKMDTSNILIEEMDTRPDT